VDPGLVIDFTDEGQAFGATGYRLQATGYHQLPATSYRLIEFGSYGNGHADH
jgi:hypothetical protein